MLKEGKSSDKEKQLCEKGFKKKEAEGRGDS